MNHFKTLPKVDLHIHFEGAIPPQTAVLLAERHGIHLPDNFKHDPNQWFTFRDFYHFIELYIQVSSLMRTPEDFTLAVKNLGASLEEQNVKHVELTFTPYFHTHLKKTTLPFDEIFPALVSGAKAVEKMYGISIQWVFDISRGLCFKDDNLQPTKKFNPAPAELTLQWALASKELGVVGFGIGGMEAEAPARYFKDYFLDAKAGGLQSLPHGGEFLGPESVLSCIHDLKADRIGHGIRCLENQEVLQEVVRSKTVLEVCPTSNICTGVVDRLENHPVRQLFEQKANIVIGSDDPSLFNCSLAGEFQNLLDKLGFAQKELEMLSLNAVAFSNLPAERKQVLTHQIRSWWDSSYNPCI